MDHSLAETLFLDRTLLLRDRTHCEVDPQHLDEPPACQNSHFAFQQRSGQHPPPRKWIGKFVASASNLLSSLDIFGPTPRSKCSAAHNRFRSASQCLWRHPAQSCEFRSALQYQELTE